VQIGDPVYIAGYLHGNSLTDLPRGQGQPGKISRLGPTFIRGHIAALLPLGITWSSAYSTGILVDATAAGGLSGAPVCNEEGEAIGILTGGIEKPLRVGAAFDPKANKPDHDHAYQVKVPTNIALVLPMGRAFIDHARRLIAAIQESRRPARDGGPMRVVEA
jgi:hypothetical protein